MSEVNPDQLKQAVEGQHGGTAVLADALPIKEIWGGKTVWEDVVHVFDWRAIPRPPGPMRGRLRSRAAANGASMPCYIWAGYGRRWMRRGRLSWRKGKDMGLYDRIVERVYEQTGKRIHHTCWIADVLSGYGLTKGPAPNRKDPNKPQKPCPKEMRPAIVEAIQHLGLLNSN